jgi:hypothetical protein
MTFPITFSPLSEYIYWLFMPPQLPSCVFLWGHTWKKTITPSFPASLEKHKKPNNKKQNYNKPPILRAVLLLKRDSRKTNIFLKL